MNFVADTHALLWWFVNSSKISPKASEIFEKCEQGENVKIVAVGMPVTRHPPHRSVHEELPHTALALGHDGKPLFRSGVWYSGSWEPKVNNLDHSLPSHT